MKQTVRHFLILTAALWLFTGLCPVLFAHISPRSPSPSPAVSPTPTTAPQPDATGVYRILNEADGTTLTVSEIDFLPCALLCEMPADAPAEALKAQAVAIQTTCRRLRGQNQNESADFTCDTAAGRVYAPPEILARQYGEDWETTYTYIRALCAEVSGLSLYYGEERITAPYFPISAGCTQTYAQAWGGEDLPYLQAVVCPADRLHSEYRTTVRFTPQEITAAFPAVSFTADPAEWFSGPQVNFSGYVNQITLCGTSLTGTQIREALSLCSAAFTVNFDGEHFVFTTDGCGHGVGMSQSAAVYMAETGASYTDILACFYPGTQLRTDGLQPAAE